MNSHRFGPHNQNIDFGHSNRTLFMDQMPEINNEAVRLTEQRLGPYIHDASVDMPNSHYLIAKGPCRLDNNAIYMGQWNSSTGQREGKGT